MLATESKPKEEVTIQPTTEENQPKEEFTTQSTASSSEIQSVSKSTPSKHTVHPATLKRLGISQEDAEKASFYFDEWDTDGNQMIDPTEFFAALTVLFEGKGKSHSFIERFAHMYFSSADLDHNGSLSWMEFLELYTRLKKLL